MNIHSRCGCANDSLRSGHLKEGAAKGCSRWSKVLEYRKSSCDLATVYSASS